MKFGVEKQATRRAMVTFCYLAFAALLVVFYAIDQDWFGKGVIMSAFIVATVGVIAGMIWMSHATREYAIDTYGKDTADERQIRVRDAAYRTAYIVFASVVLLGILYADIATSKRLSPYLWMPGSDTEWRVALTAVVLLGATLPQAVIAWREPDLPEEISDEASA